MNIFDNTKRYFVRASLIEAIQTAPTVWGKTSATFEVYALNVADIIAEEISIGEQKLVEINISLKEKNEDTTST